MARAHERPVGRIAKTGNGLARAAGSVHWYLEYEGPQAVFMDDVGNVFTFPCGTMLALTWSERRANCLVGIYTRVGNPKYQGFAEVRKQLVADLRERLHELYEACAA